MRRGFVLPLLPLMASCSPSEPAPGWEYRPNEGGYPRLIYRWDDTSELALIGNCRSSVNYILVGGNYRTGATHLTLIVDDNSWTVPTEQHAHGRHVLIEQHEQVQAIAQAKRRITFEIEGWKREVAPDSVLGMFVRACTQTPAPHTSAVV